MAKDAAFAKMYRPSSMKVARPAPPSMFACFFVRDLVCMAAFFTLPPQLSAELRKVIMDTVAVTGGHLGSGMGVVELTVALHYLYDFQDDRLVWDVGHQCYPHKLLTGRKDRFHTLRQKGGLSGFSNKWESEYDAYLMGHAGTAASAALGIAMGDRMQGRKRDSVAVVGDAAMGCGVAFEALNHAGSLEDDKLLVILNDNRWSIAKTVGALSRHLNKLRGGNFYNRTKESLHHLIQSIPVVGKPLDARLGDAVDMLKNMVVPGHLFEELGFRYFGPVDGHNMDEMLEALENVKKLDGVTLLNRRTKRRSGSTGVSPKSPGNLLPSTFTLKRIIPHAAPVHGLSHRHTPAEQTPFSEQSILVVQGNQRLLVVMKKKILVNT